MRMSKLYDLLIQLETITGSDVRQLEVYRDDNWHIFDAIRDACPSGLGRVLRGLGDTALYDAIKEYRLWSSVMIEDINQAHQVGSSWPERIVKALEKL